MKAQIDLTHLALSALPLWRVPEGSRDGIIYVDIGHSILNETV
jgi:hypothetical protein